MKIDEAIQPRGLSRRRIEQLLSATRFDDSINNRIDILSRRLLGRSYEPNPLIGSADRAEVFTTSLDGFDCVTYIETVMALARASNVNDFTTWLRKIRYDAGRIQWKRRNHYITGWIRNGVRNGIVRPVSMRAVRTVSRERVLNVVPGITAQRIRLKCISKTMVPRLAGRLQNSDLIFFVSTCKNLDVFHAGIIVRDGKNIAMRHASRNKGLVVEQELSEFLKANRMTGVIIVRPQE
jgi:hypothetical protein